MFVKRLLSLVPLIALLSCMGGEEDVVGTDKIMRPKPGPNMIMSDTIAKQSRNNTLSSEESTIKKTIDSRYQFVAGRFVDFDFDGTSEAVAMVSEKKGDEPVISLLIGNIKNNSFAPLFESVLNIAQVSSAQLSLKDMLGNHKSSIVCRGLSKDGRLSISVFSQLGGGLNFKEVLRQEASVDISLSDDIRSANYEESGNYGEPISVTITDRSQTANQEDTLLKSLYAFDPQSSAYVIKSSEKLSTETLQEEKISTLFKGKTSDLEGFLTGVWYREVVKGSKASRQILLFDAKNKTVQLLDSDRLENHFWLASQKLGGSSLQLYLENEAFRSIKAVLTLEIVDNESFNLKIMDRTEWEGSFKRIDGDLALALLNKTKHETKLFTAILSGIFSNQDGTELSFIRQGITRRKNESVEKGTWTSFVANKPIIEIAWNKNGSLSFEFFEYSIEENKKAQGLERILKLKPIDITVWGAKDTTQEASLYTQIEQSK